MKEQDYKIGSMEILKFKQKSFEFSDKTKIIKHPKGRSINSDWFVNDSKIVHLEKFF